MKALFLLLLKMRDYQAGGLVQYRSRPIERVEFSRIPHPNSGKLRSLWVTYRLHKKLLEMNCYEASHSLNHRTLFQPIRGQEWRSALLTCPAGEGAGPDGSVSFQECCVFVQNRWDSLQFRWLVFQQALRCNSSVFFGLLFCSDQKLTIGGSASTRSCQHYA